MGANGIQEGFRSRVFVRWDGVVFTVVVWMGVVEVIGTVNWFWADLGWKEPKWWRSWKLGGVEGEASPLWLYYKSMGSRSVWSILLCDLVLKRFLVWCKSNWGSCKAVRCSRTKIALWMVLTVVESSVLEFCHKIFSGSSTMVGGFGSGWDMVLILCEARFETQSIERLKFYDYFWKANLS